MIIFLIYLIIGLCSGIGFVVVKLAQQISNPSNEHYRAGYITVDICLILASIR